MGRYRIKSPFHNGATSLAREQVISGRSIEVNCFGSMSYTSTKRSESSASRRSMDMDTMEDGDDRDETKRKSRNLSEKKRRDQFNILINELCSMVSMVSNSPRKMDKSTVLKATIAFLKNHNADLSVQSQVQETQEDWKPSFLSNEEFTHLMMESMDGFIIVISCTGQILYLSESVTSLIGHLSSDLVNCSIFDYIAPEEKAELNNLLGNPLEDKGRSVSASAVLSFRVGGFGVTEENYKYQLVKIVGYFRKWINPSDCGASETNTEKSEGEFSESNDSSASTNSIFIATGRLIDADLLREMSVVVDTAKNEFSSRHSLEWKFLFLDHRAPPIIGYLPFEVLGTSGYDYYHADDLEKVATCHEALMQKGEGTSCFYRFLTKGQQWIWLQTRFYITYHQWNSKPEFIMCTHRVVSYADVMKDIRGEVQFSNVPSPRLGTSSVVSKQGKIEPKKTSSYHGALKTSNKQKSTSSYSCAGSKRSCIRKLDLPPKFVSALSTSHSVVLQKSLSQNSKFPDVSTAVPSTSVPLGPQPATLTLSIQPQISHIVQPQLVQHQVVPQALAVPIATFHPTPIRQQNQTFVISPTPSVVTSENLVTNPQGVQPIVTSSTACILQEQLLMKHAELQRQIMQQQEELRRVSEQLLMSQCGFIQGENANNTVIPQPTQVQPINTEQTEEDCEHSTNLQQVQ